MLAAEVLPARTRHGAQLRCGCSLGAQPLTGCRPRHAAPAAAARVLMPGAARAGASSREVKALLVKLLAKAPWAGLGSIIVYVAFQAAAEEAARYLRAQGVDCLCYHAGRPARVRSRLQCVRCAKGAHACDGHLPDRALPGRVDGWRPAATCADCRAARRSGRPRRRPSARAGCARWWPRSPLAWAWTAPMCAASCT